MKILFEKGDVVARPLIITKQTPEGTKRGILLTFVGRSTEEVPTENPQLLSDVILIPAKQGKLRHVGEVDFSGGWEDTIPASLRHSKYHLEIGDAEVVQKLLLKLYITALRKITPTI